MGETPVVSVTILGLPITIVAKSMNVRGETIGEVLAAAAKADPKLKPLLYSSRGELFSWVLVWLNRCDVRVTSGLETPVVNGDEVSIVFPVAGG